MSADEELLTNSLGTGQSVEISLEIGRSVLIGLNQSNTVCDPVTGQIQTLEVLPLCLLYNAYKSFNTTLSNILKFMSYTFPIFSVT